MSIHLPEVGDDLRAGEQAFLAQIAKAQKLGFQNGERYAFNQVLGWATENKEALQRAGLAADLLKICGI